MGSPDRKEPIALSVGVLKRGTFPLFPATSQPGLEGQQGHVTAGTAVATWAGAGGERPATTKERSSPTHPAREGSALSTAGQ